MSGGHIYIIHEREMIRLSEPTYKIGKSTNLNNRLQSYPKNSLVMFFIYVSDIHAVERDLIRAFQYFFEARPNYGAEYFRGNIYDMIMQTVLMCSKLIPSDISDAQSDEAEAAAEHLDSADPVDTIATMFYDWFYQHCEHVNEPDIFVDSKELFAAFSQWGPVLKIPKTKRKNHNIKALTTLLSQSESLDGLFCEKKTISGVSHWNILKKYIIVSSPTSSVVTPIIASTPSIATPVSASTPSIATPNDASESDMTNINDFVAKFVPTQKKIAGEERFSATELYSMYGKYCKAADIKNTYASVIMFNREMKKTKLTVRGDKYVF
jgi:hypothetical protein